MKISLPKYSILVVALAVIGCTALITLFRLGGVDQAAISDRYPTSITPAGYVFSIWSLIYLLWIITGIFALRHVSFGTRLKHMWSGLFGRHEDVALTSAEIHGLTAAMILTVIWLFPWHFDCIGTSVLVMLVLAGILGRLLHDSHRSPYWFRLTVEVFAGWILIATIANISVWLVSLGLLSSDSMPWKIGVIIVAAGINAYSVWRYKSW